MSALGLWSALAAGSAAGLASAPHCAAMCGPLSVWACQRAGAGAPWRYQLGRSLGYLTLGAISGQLGASAVSLANGSTGAWVAAGMSWTLAVALLVSAWRLWRSGASPGRPLQLGKSGPDRPSLFERAAARLPRSAFVTGSLTALLPCGALALAVMLAAGTAHPLHGAAAMLGFATTSGVALIAAAWVAARLSLRRPAVARALACLLVAGAVVLAWRPIAVLRTGAPACHDIHAVRPAAAPEQTPKEPGRHTLVGR